MSEQYLEGIGQIGLQDIQHSTINIQQYIGQSAEYSQLLEHIKELQELLALIPENNTEKRKELVKKIGDREKQISAFKNDVLRLAETFGSIELYSEPMRRAKQFFDEGRFREADAILNAGDLLQEQQNLLQQKNRLNNSLRNNANAFLVKAQATALDFDHPERYTLACTYFEQSLAASRNLDNLGAYIKFLKQHYKLSKAFELCTEAVQLSKPIGGITLSNCLYHLGEIYYYWNRVEEARETWQEALAIVQTLYDSRHNHYFINFMLLTEAMGIIHFKTGNWKEAEKSFSQQVAVYEMKVNEDPETYTFYLTESRYKLMAAQAEMLPFKEIKPGLLSFISYLRKNTDVVSGLNQKYLFSKLSNILLVFHRNNEYETALQLSNDCLNICREEAKLNPEATMPDMARGYNRHGSILINTKNYADALEAFRKAESILANLSKEEPDEFLHDYARTLSGIGKCEHALRRHNEAETSFKQALMMRRQFAEKNRLLFLSDLADTIKDFALLRYDQGQYNEALQLYAEATAMFSELNGVTPGKFDLPLSVCYFNTALCYNQKEDLPAAVIFLEKCAALRRPFSEANPANYFLDFGTCLYNIAVIYTHHIQNREKAMNCISEIISKNKQYELDAATGLLFELIRDTAVLAITWQKRDAGEME